MRVSMLLLNSHCGSLLVNTSEEVIQVGNCIPLQCLRTEQRLDWFTIVLW